MQQQDLLTWLLIYPTAKDDRTHPCPCMSHLNSSAIGTMAIGIMTRSAELIKLAIEHSAIMRDGRTMDAEFMAVASIYVH